MIEGPASLSASPDWPYLSAAAVLTDFAAEKLQPLGGGKPDVARVGAMLMEHGEPIAIGPAKGRWSLSNTARRAALAELKRQGQLADALRANRGPDAPDNPTQRALDALLSGNQPDLSCRSLTDLLGLERAIDLLGPVIDDRQNVHPQILAQIERLRLLEPLQRLVADGFAGRATEMRALRSYVDELPPRSFREWLARGVSGAFDVFRRRPPLVIHGPGGVGKSTLLAKFLLEHAGPEQAEPVPFIYLDFDRGQLDPWRPDTILGEAFRQIGVQFPDFAKPAAGYEAQTEIRIASEDTEAIAKSGHFERSSQLRRDFVNLLQDISASHGRNLLLFIDTFEVVQRRGPTPAYNVLTLAAELLMDMPRLRIVISGRAPLRKADFLFAKREPPQRKIGLKGFDAEAGRAYLSNRLRKLDVSEASPRALDRIVSLVDGNPLSLRLAAQVFAREDLRALEDTVSQARFDAAFTAERLQGVLHNRIVDQLPDRLRKIADPGLIVRRITPGVIGEVLAGPCELELKEPGEADQLFQDLMNEVALVEPDGDGVLRHRPDVRLIMLPLLREKLGEQARKIDQAAADYWTKRPDDPEARTEEVYHLLWLGADDAALESVWQRGPIDKPDLDEIFDELEAVNGPPAARIWLCRKLGREIPSELEQSASLREWERHAEIRARGLLATGEAEEALRALRGRADRLPASPLWLLEIEALKLLGRDDEAVVVVDKAWGIAADARDPAPAHVHALLLQKTALLERSGQLDEALASVVQAAELARSIANPVLEFETGITRARLLRKLGRDEDGHDLVRGLAAMVNAPSVASALAARPALLIEAAAEIGVLRPELLIDAAQRLGTESGDQPAQAFTLIGLGVAFARRGEPERAIELYQRARSAAQASGDRVGEATSLLHLGNAYRDLGRTHEAVALFEESLKIARELHDHKAVLSALNTLGTADADQGELRSAITYYEESITIAQTISDLEGEGAATGNLANVYLRLGQRDRAIELLEKDLAIARKIGDQLGARQTLSNLGNAYLDLGDASRAAELYEQSLAIARQLGDARGEANVLGNLGSLYIDLNQPHRGLEYLHKALERSQRLGDRAGEARVLGNLGIVHRKLGDPEEARQYYSRQLGICRNLGDQLGEGTARYNLALALDAMGDRGPAHAEMQRAFEILETAGSPLARQAHAWLTENTENARPQEAVKIGQEVSEGEFEEHSARRTADHLEALNIGQEVKQAEFETLRTRRDSARTTAEQQIGQTIGAQVTEVRTWLIGAMSAALIAVAAVAALLLLWLW